jgi:hypothetical protein
MSLITWLSGHAQTFPDGMAYQAQVFDTDGAFMSGATVGIEFTIRSGDMAGTIVWQEQHTVTLNEMGHFSTVIGEGISTGMGTAPSFDAISWGSATHFLEMAVDRDLSGTYLTSLNQQMMAVPYAFHAKTTAQKFKLTQLLDVDTLGIEIGDVLKWDGDNWVPEEDLYTDTLDFVFYADSANYADTADFALNCETPVWVDSAGYAMTSDTANFALSGFHSLYADSAVWADTAGVVGYAINNWGINGNDNVVDGPHFLGTIDSVDLIFKTNNVERMRILGNGRIGIGTSDPLAGWHVNNTNGFVFTGTHGVGDIPIEGPGSRVMWYPGKSAFRSGYVTSTFWNDGLIGNYSFAAGYNTRATANYSVAFGFNSRATGEASFAAGNASISSGDYAFSAGHNPIASGDHSIALGRAAEATAESAIAIGYHPTADAPFGLSLGNYTYAHGESSVAIGYHAWALHDGSFIFNDKADAFGYVETTAENQFMVKASGGTVFYTDEDLTTGVELLPGAGAWSILSDRERKENILSVNPQEYLNRLDSIDVFSWSYIAQDSSITHIGPMAQDFYATFQLGLDSTTINSGDFDGVNLLLLKALNERVSEIQLQEVELNRMREELAALKTQREKLERMLLELSDEIKEQSTLGATNEN